MSLICSNARPDEKVIDVKANYSWRRTFIQVMVMAGLGWPETISLWERISTTDLLVFYMHRAWCTLFSETTSVWNWPDRGSRWIHRIHLAAAEEARVAPTCNTLACNTLALVTPRIVGPSTCYASLFTLDFPSVCIIFPGKIKPAIRSSPTPTEQW